MNLRGIILIAVFIVIHSPGLSQSRKLDSLKAALNEAKEDTNKVKTLLALNDAVVLQNANAGMNYSSQALALSEKLSFRRGVAASYYSIGRAWDTKLNYPEALSNFLAALRIFENLKDKKGIAQCYSYVGQVYYMQDNDAEALRNLYNALKLFEELQDSAAITNCLISIGASYYYQKNNAEALKYYNRALEMSKSTGNQNNLAYVTKNIGLLDYLSANDDYNAGNKNNAARKYAIAIEKIQFAINRYKLLENRYGLMETYPLLGNVYQRRGVIALQENNPAQAANQFKLALDLYSLFLNIAEEANDPNYMSEAYNNLGSIYINLKNYEEARRCLEKTLMLSAPAGLRTTMKDSYFSLAVLDSCENKFEQALAHYKKFILYRDSSINEESTKKITALRMQYDVEKKEDQIQLLSTENKLQTALASKESQRKNFAYAGIALIVFIGGYGFYRYRRKKKIQNIQMVMNERLRISRELHDEVGATLSGIAMYGHLAKEQIKTNQPAETEKSLDIMQQSSAEMVNKLNDIVWLINPEQDSLQKLIERLEEYATTMAAVKNMQVKVIVPEKISAINLPVENRRNIYLFCKEAINNAVKYSNGNLLELIIKETGGKMEFSVIDNGKGFDAFMIKRGNGLENMQKRADEIGAKLLFQSKMNEGAVVSMQVNITQ